MPKETRLASGAQHRSRLEPYPTKPLPSTTAPAKSARSLASSTTPAPVITSSSSSSSPNPPSIAIAMDPYASPPPSTAAEVAANSGFGIHMTSPGNERASTAWTEEDDQRLMVLRSKNMNWIAIAQNFHAKTGNACRKRHERLVEKRNAQGWDGVRLSDLATAYMDCREIMWKMVAERCGGEKWQTIEQKCMEKGFKTLSSAARATKRQSAAGIMQQQMQPNGLGESPEYYETESIDPRWRDSGYHEPQLTLNKQQLNGASASYEYHFGTQPASESLFYTAPPPASAHSRRPSAAHSIGPYSVDHHSSRSNSHGPPGPVSTMAPLVANNPFASPQPYYGDAGMTAMPAGLSGTGQHPVTYPGTSNRSLQAGHPALPSISNGAFDPPMGQRLPSIIGTQG